MALIRFKNLTISSYSIQIDVHNDEEIVEDHVYLQEISFLGREEELKQLETKLFSEKLVVVSGLAGFGKTTLALKFSWDKREIFKNNLAFINAESEASLRLSFGDLSKELKINVNEDLSIQSVIKKVYLHFKNTGCLFIFDNAESYSAISSFLPTKYFEESTDIYIIVTSLSEDWDNCESIKLDALSPIGALKILNAIIKEYDSYSTTLWEDLIDCLDRIPLAIQIVGALICNKIHKSSSLIKFNLEKYIEGLRTEKIDVTLKRLPSNTDLSYTSTIYTAVKKSIDYLQSKNDDYLDILCVISYLNPICIKEKHLSTILHEVQDLDNCLEEMIKLSLIRRHTIGPFESIFVHRVVQKTLRNYQKEERISQKYINLIMNAILTDKEICHRHQHTVLKYLEENIEYSILFFDYTPNLREKYLHFLTENDSHIVLRAIFKKYSKTCRSKVNKNISVIIKNLDLLKIASNNFSVSTMQLLIPYHYTNTYDMPTAYTLLSKQFETDESNVIEIIQTMLHLNQDKYNHDQQIKLLHSVTKTNNINLIKTFLSRQLDLLDINKQDSEGNTVIHNLLNCKNLELSNVIHTINLISKIDILNPYLKNKTGQTIMSAILATKNSELINIFLTNILNNDDIFRQIGHGSTMIYNIKTVLGTEDIELKDVTDTRERLIFTYFDNENNKIYLNYPIRCIFKHPIMDSYLCWVKEMFAGKQKRSVGKIVILTKHLKLVLMCMPHPWEKMFDVNDRDFNNQRTIVDSILSLCLKSKHYEDAIPVIEHLSKSGLDPFLKNGDNLTIIEKLISTKCWALVANFINNTNDKYNFSTFHDEAYDDTVIHLLFDYCLKDDANIAKILLNTKIVQINPLITNYYGNTCLEMVLLTKNWDIIQLYILKSINKDNINNQTKSGDTFLTLLLKNLAKDFEFVNEFENQHKNLFKQINDTTTLLESYQKENNIEYALTKIQNKIFKCYYDADKIVYILQKLKDCNLDPHIQSSNGCAVYQVVLNTLSPNIINTFINNAFTKDNVNHQDEYGNAIMHRLFYLHDVVYSFDRKKKTLALLLNLGANPNLKNHKGLSGDLRFWRP